MQTEGKTSEIKLYPKHRSSTPPVIAGGSQKGSHRRKWSLASWVLIFFLGFCAPGCWIFTSYSDADEIHGWLPFYLSNTNRERNFAELHRMWNRYDQSFLNRGSTFQTARLHVACGITLWYWDLASSSDRKTMHEEALSAMNQVSLPPPEYNGDRMIYYMSRITDLKWKKMTIKDYKMSQDDKTLWKNRGEYFAMNHSPE